MGNSISKIRSGEPSSESSSVSSNSNTRYIPMDLVTDILSRLPVKSLFRFKCVSKPWHALIETPSFIKSHQEITTQNPHPIFSAILAIHSVYDFETTRTRFKFRINLIDALDKPIDMDLPFMSDCYYEVVGVSNGFICIMLWDDPDRIVVCNQVTGMFKSVRAFDFHNKCPAYSPIIYGFGANKNGYEIVRIDYTSKEVKLHTFSSVTTVWKDVNVKMGKREIYSDPNVSMEPLRAMHMGSGSIFRNGVYYWEARVAPCVGHVVIFDASNEVFDEIWAPNNTSGGTWWKLKELNEKLVAVIYRSSVEIDLWALNESDQTWEMFYSVVLDDLISRYYSLSVVGCAGNGKLVLAYQDDGYKLYLYDMYTNDGCYLPYVNVRGHYELYLFTESLAHVETSEDVVERKKADLSK